MISVYEPLSKRTGVFFFLLVGLCSSGSGRANAQSALSLARIDKGRIRVDGALRDWRGISFSPVGEGDDASMSFALGFDDEGLFLATIVTDDRFVRRARPSTKEDAVILTLAMPAGERRWRGSEIWLYAGIPGRQAACASIAAPGRKPKRLKGVRIVEGPVQEGGGYVLEAYIPWSNIPGGRAWRRGRGTIRLRDVDRAARPVVEREPTWAATNPRLLGKLPPLQPEGEQLTDPFKSFLQSRGLSGLRPKFDLKGNVSGDRRRERVYLVSNFVVITGPGHRGGKGFSYAGLPVETEADIRSARLRDLTGDRKRELIVRMRQRTEWGAHELWQVLSLTGPRPTPLLTVQVRVETAAGFAQCRIAVQKARKRGPPFIKLCALRAVGLDRYSFRKPRLGGVESVLLPWDVVEERVYRWDGQRFEVVSEKENPGEAAVQQNANRAAVAERPAPVGRGGAVGVGAMFAAFRRSQGIDSSEKARFRRKANLAGDKRKETVAVIGKSLLVAGPGFRGGNRYFFSQLPVKDPSDVLVLKTADVTGDRRDDVIIRIRQALGDMERQLVLVSHFNGDNFRQLLAVEVKRQQGRNKIENRTRLLRRGRLRVLEVRAGRAKGWSDRTYPFAVNQSGGVDPLLLPWRDRMVRYRFDGERLVR